MRAVKSAGTGPERALEAALAAYVFPFSKHVCALPGSPDFLFPEQRLAVFVHGCFWHGHHCPRGARAPKANAAYWADKIARNRQRDARAARALRAAGYAISTVWECRLKRADAVAARLIRRLEKRSLS